MPPHSQEEKNWCHGYQLSDDLSVYNPKSVVESMMHGRFGTYWNRTETQEALKVYIQMNMDGLKNAVIRMLAGGSLRINTGTFSNDMTTFSSKDDMLTLLVHLGYLSYNFNDSTVTIPNKEVSQEYVNAISTMEWSEVTRSVEASRVLLDALWRQDGDTVASGIDRAHNEISIFSYNDENSLSCTISLAFYYAREYYTMIREMPTGRGLADLCLLPRPLHMSKPAAVIELKWNHSAEGAIAQFKEKHYTDALQDYHGNLLLAGINYNKKQRPITVSLKKYR